MIVSCEECGVSVKMPPSRFRRSEHHFCSKTCHMIHMNRELNPTRMNDKVREKLRNVRLGTGKGDSYEKTYGKHTHRIIAEQMLGRPLKPGEIVHHIDENKRNNNPSNLMVMTQAEHCKIHFSKGGGDALCQK